MQMKSLDDMSVKELLVLNLKTNSMILTAVSNSKEFSSPPKREVKKLLNDVQKIIDMKKEG